HPRATRCGSGITGSFGPRVRAAPRFALRVLPLSQMRPYQMGDSAANLVVLRQAPESVFSSRAGNRSVGYDVPRPGRGVVPVDDAGGHEPVARGARIDRLRRVRVVP